MSAEALAAELRERINRYNAALDLDEDADPTEILSPETAALRRELLVAALTDDVGQVVELGGINAGHLWLAAWVAQFRDNGFTTMGDGQSAREEAANAMRLFLVVDSVRPDLVPSRQRTWMDGLAADGTGPDLAYRERELAEVLLSDEHTGIADLDIAATLLRRSLDRGPSDRVRRRNALMRVLWRRYRLSSDIGDLAAAVDAAEEALALADGTSRVITLRQIGAMEQERYDRTGVTSHLRRCVTVLQEALDLTPPGDGERAETLVSLGIALRAQGSLERSPDDLGRAVALMREALSGGILTAANRASSLSMLALALHARFELTRSGQDLTEAVSVAREAANTDVEEERAVRLGNLGLILGTRHHHSRDRNDLAELVAVARQTVALPGDRRQHGIALGLLSTALSYAAEASGRLEDLNEAIEAARAAVAALADHPERLDQLHNLARALRERFRRTQGVEDLDESIKVARTATMTSADDPRRAGRLSLLAGTLEDRYRLRGDIDDLLGAVAAGEEAVLCSPASAAEHAALLSNLSIARRALAERTGQLRDADAAIQVAARASSIDGDETAARPIRLMNLAACHVLRFRITSDLADLDQAIAMLRDALAGVAVLDPNRCTYLSELGQRLVERDTAAPDRWAPGVLGEAIGLFREAVGLATAPIVDRVRAAGRWGYAAALRGVHDEAAAGHAAAVRLLPLAAWHGLDRRSQERQLTIWSPIVTSAAAWAIGLGRVNEAVELLEQGRGVLWAHQLGRHVDLTALRAVRPDLADRLDEIRRHLDSVRRPR